MKRNLLVQKWQRGGGRHIWMEFTCRTRRRRECSVKVTLNQAEGMKLNCLTIDNYNSVMPVLDTLCRYYSSWITRWQRRARLYVFILWTRWSVVVPELKRYRKQRIVSKWRGDERATTVDGNVRRWQWEKWRDNKIVLMFIQRHIHNFVIKEPWLDSAAGKMKAVGWM